MSPGEEDRPAAGSPTPGPGGRVLAHIIDAAHLAIADQLAATVDEAVAAIGLARRCGSGVV